MSQDELILTLLRAMARSMVCEKCGGSGKVSDWSHEPGVTPLPSREIPCSCRLAIRDLLKPQGV